MQVTSIEGIRIGLNANASNEGIRIKHRIPNFWNSNYGKIWIFPWFGIRIKKKTRFFQTQENPGLVRFFPNADILNAELRYALFSKFLSHSCHLPIPIRMISVPHPIFSEPGECGLRGVVRQHHRQSSRLEADEKTKRHEAQMQVHRHSQGNHGVRIQRRPSLL